MYSCSLADPLTVVFNRIVNAFNKSGATRSVKLDIYKVFAGFNILAFFTKSSFMEFQVRCSALYCHFLVEDSFEWFWIGSLTRMSSEYWCFSRLHTFTYTLMTFLKILSVTLLSMLITLFATLNMTGHLICGNN